MAFLEGARRAAVTVSRAFLPGSFAPRDGVPCLAAMEGNVGTRVEIC
jgi:hypothetical protein